MHTVKSRCRGLRKILAQLKRSVLSTFMNLAVSFINLLCENRFHFFACFLGILNIIKQVPKDYITQFLLVFCLYCVWLYSQQICLCTMLYLLGNRGKTHCKCKCHSQSEMQLIPVLSATWALLPECFWSESSCADIIAESSAFREYALHKQFSLVITCDHSPATRMLSFLLIG